MSPRTPSQLEVIRQQKIRLIYDVALELFATHGYASTSVSMIARRAGISKGLMYNYFESKEELLRRIVMGGFQQFLGLLKVENERNVKKEEIINFIDENIRLLKRDYNYYKMYFSLTFQPEVFNLLKEEVMQYFMGVMNILVSYYAKRGVPSPLVKARFLFAVFDGIAVHYISDVESFPLDESRDLLIELL